MTAARPQPTSTPSSESSLDPTGQLAALETAITPLLEAVQQIAQAHSTDPQVLLALLRHLEHLHRSIQDGPFRSSLPSERSSLFQLLQDMELSGGWPYIPRLQLRTFLDLLQQEEEGHGVVEDPAADVAEAA
ncbi:MAG: hypothetical protein ACKOYK_06530 [Cyanobium sp.]